MSWTGRCAGGGGGDWAGGAAAGEGGGDPPGGGPGRRGCSGRAAGDRAAGERALPRRAAAGARRPAAVARTVRGRSSRRGNEAGRVAASAGGTAGPSRTWPSEPTPRPPPTTDTAIAATIAAGTRIATPEARSAWRIHERTTKWTVARQPSFVARRRRSCAQRSRSITRHYPDTA